MGAFVSIAKWEEHVSGVTMSGEEGTVDLRFVAPDIIRVKLFNGEGRTEPSFVLREDGVLKEVPVTVTSQDDQITLASTAVTLHIQRAPFSLKIFNVLGQQVFHVPENGLMFSRGRTVHRIAFSKDEQIYGLGQGNYPHLNLRDQERRIWHEWRGFSQSGPGGIPFFVSSRGYGFLLNTSYPSRFAIGRAEPPPSPDPPLSAGWAPAPWRHDESSGETNPDDIAVLVDCEEMEYFVIVRWPIAALLRGYRELTGEAPLPPVWALGYIQSKNRYRSQWELLEVGRKYREKGIPGDVLVIDWLWFKNFGDLDWDRTAWPEPRGFLHELASMGFKVMQAQHPFVERNAKNWGAFFSRGFLVEFPNKGEPRHFLTHDSLYDFSNPEARLAWWEKVKRLYDEGIRAYWIDMGEPEQHPPGSLHFLGSRERVHNIYTLLWAKALYEGQRSHTDERVFSLARTTYAGIQRYGCAMWSGDISPTWEVLKAQVIIGQQVCLSGQPYWTTDIGGFMSVPFYESELYVRWLQWGMWCPIFRTHGTRPGNEPWSFGPQIEAIVTSFIRLRYRLMPYIYAQAWETHKTGMPMMQAMVLQYPDDPKAADSERQFMFGPSFLIVPVTERGVREQQVYLPKGRWYDFWTDRVYEGPGEIHAFAPLERIPIYIKAGSIIPNGPEVLHTRDAQWNPLTIHVYPGQDAQFVLYEDDGNTYAYERGEYSETLIEYFEAAKSLIIHGTKGSFSGQQEAKSYHVVFHDVDESRLVLVNGEPVHKVTPQPFGTSWIYDPRSRRLTVQLPMQPIRGRTSVTLVPAHERVDHVSARNIGAEEAILKLDISQPGPGSAVVYAYIEGGLLPEGASEETSVDWELSAPQGWEAEELDMPKPQQALAFHTWRLKATGLEFTPGSEAIMRARIVSPGGNPMLLISSIALTSEFLSFWKLLGPFTEEDEKTMEARESELAQRLVFQSVNVGHEQHEWKKYNGFDCFGYVDLNQELMCDPWKLPQEIRFAYAASHVWSPQVRDVIIEMLGEDHLKLWVNGQMVAERYNEPLFGPFLVKTRLQAGWNRLLLKCTKSTKFEPGGRSWGFFIKILSDEHQIMRDLKFCSDTLSFST